MFYGYLNFTILKTLVHLSSIFLPRICLFFLNFLFICSLNFSQRFIYIVSNGLPLSGSQSVFSILHILETPWLRPPVPLVVSSPITWLPSCFLLSSIQAASQLTVLFYWPLVHYTSWCPFFPCSSSISLHSPLRSLIYSSSSISLNAIKICWSTICLVGSRLRNVITNLTALSLSVSQASQIKHNLNQTLFSFKDS